MPVALLNAQLGIAHIGSELGAAPKMLLARMASPPRPQGGHGESKGTWGEGNQTWRIAVNELKRPVVTVS